MADQWYYTHDDDKVGPCSAQELKDLAAAGKIRPTDTIWKEGLERGVVASRVKNLFTPAPASSPSQAAVETVPAAPVTAETPAPEHPKPSVFVSAAEQPPPENLEEKPSLPRQPPPKKGRATAVKGAVIANQDGTFCQYVKKCVKCGYQDNCRHRMPIRSGATRTTFYCPKCRKISPVEIQGSI